MTIEIADRLIKLRKKNGYSQEEVADKLGLSRQAVSKWERAEASPDTDNLICLAKLYGISLDELLATDDDIDTIVKEQVKKEDEPVPEKEKEGIHLVDDEGQKMSITDDGVTCYDENGNIVKKCDKQDRVLMIIGAIEGGLFTLAIVAYVLLGVLFNMWWNAWILFFLPDIICSVGRAIRKKNAHQFNMVFTALFTFFFVCMVLPGKDADLWHPMWLVFLAIPVYYTMVGVINKIVNRNNEEEEKEKGQ